MSPLEKIKNMTYFIENILEIHWKIHWKSIGNLAGIRPASGQHPAGIQPASGQHLAGIRLASGRRPAGSKKIQTTNNKYQTINNKQ